MKIKDIITEMFSSMRSNWAIPVVENQIYSTQETRIGVYEMPDGTVKPLYRRVIKGNISIVSMQTYIDNSLNISTIKLVNIYGEIYGNNWNAALPCSHVKSGEEFAIRLGYNDTGIFISASGPNLAWVNGNNYNITVEYTKTTDTASTAPKVPFEPLIEYSTDEKMIGYWIDGKPIYEKTVTGTIVEGSDTIMTGLTGKLIRVEGFFSGDGWQEIVPCYGGSNNTYVYAQSGGNVTLKTSKINDKIGYIGKEYYITLRYTKE